MTSYTCTDCNVPTDGPHGVHARLGHLVIPDPPPVLPVTCTLCNTEPATLRLIVLAPDQGWTLIEAADAARRDGWPRCNSCFRYSYPSAPDYAGRVLLALPL